MWQKCYSFIIYFRGRHRLEQEHWRHQMDLFEHDNWRRWCFKFFQKSHSTSSELLDPLIDFLYFLQAEDCSQSGCAMLDQLDDDRWGSEFQRADVIHTVCSSLRILEDWGKSKRILSGPLSKVVAKWKQGFKSTWRFTYFFIGITNIG